MNIIIKTPKPYTLTIGNNSFEVVSIHKKVKDILKDLDINLGELDYTKPGLDQVVSIGGGEIQIFKVKEEIEEIEKPIPPHESVTQKSDDMDIGVTKVVQEGQDGLKKISVKKKYLKMANSSRKK